MLSVKYARKIWACTSGLLGCFRELEGMAMTSDDGWQNAGKVLAPNEVAFDYIKGHDFKVVWADGAIGGITPNGLIHLAVYSERPAIPRRQVHEIERVDDDRGKLGKEVVEKRLSRGSVVREMSCDLMMAPQTAENLANWLLQQVEEIKKAAGQ